MHGVRRVDVKIPRTDVIRHGVEIWVFVMRGFARGAGSKSWGPPIAFGRGPTIKIVDLLYK